MTKLFDVAIYCNRASWSADSMEHIPILVILDVVKSNINMLSNTYLFYTLEEASQHVKPLYTPPPHPWACSPGTIRGVGSHVAALLSRHVRRTWETGDFIQHVIWFYFQTSKSQGFPTYNVITTSGWDWFDHFVKVLLKMIFSKIISCTYIFYNHFEYFVVFINGYVQNICRLIR